MSPGSKHDKKPWTAEDDAVLVAAWSDPDLDFAAIAERLTRGCSAEAVKHRGYRMGLGRKARHKKVKKSAKDLMSERNRPPAFEDHPQAIAPGSRFKAARLGSRLGSVSRDAESSRTGSSLDGAAFHPSGRRV
jgi:hypothetical protein